MIPLEITLSRLGRRRQLRVCLAAVGGQGRGPSGWDVVPLTRPLFPGLRVPSEPGTFPKGGIAAGWVGETAFVQSHRALSSGMWTRVCISV